jgi:hypothetical protein
LPRCTPRPRTRWPPRRSARPRGCSDWGSTAARAVEPGPGCSPTSRWPSARSAGLPTRS